MKKIATGREGRLAKSFGPYLIDLLCFKRLTVSMLWILYLVGKEKEKKSLVGIEYFLLSWILSEHSFKHLMNGIFVWGSKR